VTCLSMMPFRKNLASTATVTSLRGRSVYIYISLFIRNLLIHRSLYRHFLERTAREIGIKIGHELASTYPRVFRVLSTSVRPMDSPLFVLSGYTVTECHAAVMNATDMGC
jgi:hypothetical protein